jgi:ABC-type multidrug transport system fused ATPase/permease subunit
MSDDSSVGWRRKFAPLSFEVAQLFAIFWRADARLAFAWWLLITVGALLPAVMMVALGGVVDCLARAAPYQTAVAAFGAAFVAMNAVAALSDLVSASLGSRAAEWMHRRLLAACLAPDGVGHLERPGLAAKLAAARDFDLGTSGAPLVVCVPRIAARLIGVGAASAQGFLLFAFRWWAPLLLAAGWLSTSVFLRKSSKWDERFSEDSARQQQRAQYDYQLMVDAPAAKEVRVFGLASWLGDEFRRRRLAVFEQSWKARGFRWPAFSKSVLAVGVANAVVFAALLDAALAGSVPLPRLVVFVQAAIGMALLGFGDDYFLRTAAQTAPLVLGLADSMETAGSVASGTLSAVRKPAVSLSFDNVAFQYPGSDRQVLTDFNLEIPAGTSLAIVGENGAGKTTLTKLLGRLYDPTRGAIRVDGVELDKFDLQGWRAQMAVVFQDFIRYEWTLRDNVAPGCNDEALVMSALRSARAEGLAQLDAILAKGYQNGTELSGGQWQRVALARAMAQIRRGATLVVLDEPTAQLDVRGEERMFNQLLAETRGLTTIIISHRFSTVRRADRICVIEQGRATEIGTHAELMAKGGAYKRMFDVQAARFEEGMEVQVA